MDLTYSAIALTVVVTLLGAAGLWKLWRRVDKAEPAAFGAVALAAFRQAEREVLDLKTQADEAAAAHVAASEALARIRAKVANPSS